jgi:hypothetical protein
METRPQRSIRASSEAEAEGGALAAVFTAAQVAREIDHRRSPD